MKGIAVALLLVLTVLAGCTSDGSDADGDGLDDSLERSGWSPQTVEFMDRRVEVAFASDPNMVDTDGDGLTDQEEFFIRSNPAQKDTDGDGLTDCQETRHTNATECEEPGFDSEGDGDGGYGTDPRKADSDPGPSAYKLQQDWIDETGSGPPQWGDGISDGEEVLGYHVTAGDRRVRIISDPRAVDSDDDGLEDGEEALTYGTLPHVPDSDGDGCVDAFDPWPHVDRDPSAGLEELVLESAPDGEAELRLTVLFYDEVRSITSDGPIKRGDAWDLRPHDEPVPMEDACKLSIRNPWTLIQVVVYDRTRGENLDFTSHTFSGEGLWWHIPAGDFAAEEGGAPLFSDTLVVVQGEHGSVSFSPGLRG